MRAFPGLGRLLFLLLGLATCAQGEPPSWVFNPQKAGRALYQGGWMTEYSLGTINASPEFSFPLRNITTDGIANLFITPAMDHLYE